MQIEFIESYRPNGEMHARLAGDILAKRGPGASYTIIVAAGAVRSRSSNGSKAGWRYYRHPDYDAAQAHAIKWASRKPRAF